jgi:hypothetical protein
VRKSEGKRPLERSRRRCEDNIKMDLQKVRWGAWTALIWLALVNAVMNLRVPYNAGNFLTSLEPVSLSRRTLVHGVSTCTVLQRIRLKTKKFYIVSVIALSTAPITRCRGECELSVQKGLPSLMRR